MFSTPILLIIFNRPETTRKVFETIRQQKPKHLFVAADGPRTDRTDDFEKCKAARNIIRPDWDCEFHTLYHDENLGCGKGPSQAITWFFSQVEEGIILEDDCVPNTDFFQYCTQLLDYFRDNEGIFFIGGTNFQCGIERGNGSYYFSAGNQGTWGWATWRRAWKNFDYHLRDTDHDTFEKSIHYLFDNKWQRRYWMEIFERVKKDQFGNSCWDYQFYFSGWVNGSLAIIPNKNLVCNLGFGDDATHTKGITNPLMNMHTNSILPLIHPSKISLNKKADMFLYKKFIQSYVFGLNGIRHRITYANQKIKKILGINGSWSQLLTQQNG